MFHWKVLRHSGNVPFLIKLLAYSSTWWCFWFLHFYFIYGARTYSIIYFDIWIVPDLQWFSRNEDLVNEIYFPYYTLSSNFYLCIYLYIYLCTDDQCLQHTTWFKWVFSLSILVYSLAEMKIQTHFSLSIICYLITDDQSPLLLYFATVLHSCDNLLTISSMVLVEELTCLWMFSYIVLSEAF